MIATAVMNAGVWLLVAWIVLLCIYWWVDQRGARQLRDAREHLDADRYRDPVA